MFYLKSEFEGNEIKVDLYGDSIFTTCFNCGKEIRVDEEVLRDLLNDKDFSFCGTSISCCGYKRPKLMRIK